jgi:hypothetical protein
MERRYIARVVGVRPEIIETRTDYLVAVPRSRKAFVVTMNPMAETIVGRATALAVVRKAQEKDLPVFGDGRCIVYVLNDAWESDTLVERVASVVAESQLSGLVLQVGACSRLTSALRAVWGWRGWLRGLGARRSELEIDEIGLAEAQPASVSAPAGSGEAPERAPSGAELEDTALV